MLLNGKPLKGSFRQLTTIINSVVKENRAFNFIQSSRIITDAYHNERKFRVLSFLQIVLKLIGLKIDLAENLPEIKAIKLLLLVYFLGLNHEKWKNEINISRHLALNSLSSLSVNKEKLENHQEIESEINANVSTALDAIDIVLQLLWQRAGASNTGKESLAKVARNFIEYRIFRNLLKGKHSKTVEAEILILMANRSDILHRSLKDLIGIKFNYLYRMALAK